MFNIYGRHSHQRRFSFIWIIFNQAMQTEVVIKVCIYLFFCECACSLQSVLQIEPHLCPVEEILYLYIY